MDDTGQYTKATVQYTNAMAQYTKAMAVYSIVYWNTEKYENTENTK